MTGQRITPTERRPVRCSTCPYNEGKHTGPLDPAVEAEVGSRIMRGEEWVCHSSLDGARVTERSFLCAGAKSAAERAEVPVLIRSAVAALQAASATASEAIASLVAAASSPQ